MRIGINTLFLIPSEVGGTETHAVELLKAIAENHSDTELVVFTNAENHGMWTQTLCGYPQVKICGMNFRARSRFNRIIHEQFYLPARAAAENIDCLLSLGYTAPFFCKVPQAVFVHDMQYTHFARSFNFAARVAMHLLVSWGSRHCQRILVPSEFSKREVLRFTKAAPDKVYTIYHGVKTRFSERLSEDTAESLLGKIENLKKPFILAVSFSHIQKNLPLLIESFRCLCERIPHQLVLVGGQGRGEEAVVRAFKTLPEGRGLRLNNLGAETLAALYQNADVFVFPSLYEGFGLPVLEAMSARCPVITTRNASIPEVGGECVVYFDAKNGHDLQQKILQTLSWDAETRNRHTEDALRRAHAFNWKKSASETLDCIRSLKTRG